MNGARRLAYCFILVFATNVANANTTDPVDGHRIFRFTPNSDEFTTFKTTWNNNSSAYFRDGDVFEFEESDEPYVFTRNMWIQRHPYLIFRGVKADGSDADKTKVVFTYVTEGASSFFQMEAASNFFANITFAGMALDFRTPGNVVSNCVFSGINDRSAIYGNTTAAEVVAYDSFFTNNVHSSSYAVIRSLKAFAVTNCVFADNLNATTSIDGGGVMASVITLSCEKCIFMKNRTTGWYGGAIFQNGGNIALDHCSFVGNSETVTYNRNDGCGGGAVSILASATGHIRNCLFASNSCTTSINKNNRSYGGGAIYVSGNATAISIENCTFSGNSVSVTSGETGKDIGGALLVSSGMVGVTNCVFQENRTLLTAGNWGSWNTAHIYVPAAGWDLVSNCLEANFTYGGSTYDFSATENTSLHNLVNGVNGNKVGDYDPLFADAANGDYRLEKKSPCRDAGAVLSWMTPSSLDLAGNERVFGDAPDIGCYEWLQKYAGLIYIVR